MGAKERQEPQRPSFLQLLAALWRADDELNERTPPGEDASNAPTRPEEDKGAP